MFSSDRRCTSLQAARTAPRAAKALGLSGGGWPRTPAAGSHMTWRELSAEEGFEGEDVRVFRIDLAQRICQP